MHVCYSYNPKLANAHISHVAWIKCKHSVKNNYFVLWLLNTLE